LAASSDVGKAESNDVWGAWDLLEPGDSFRWWLSDERCEFRCPIRYAATAWKSHASGTETAGVGQE